MTRPRSRVPIAVLVFNLGGPERIEDVKPFLYRLFSDPEIIRIKWPPLRKAVAYGIATLRRKTSFIATCLPKRHETSCRMERIGPARRVPRQPASPVW